MKKHKEVPEKDYCQNCKFQTNKPSFCKFFGRHTKRKDVCSEYKRG